MAKKSIYLGIIILVIAAIFLGFQIYQRQSKINQPKDLENLQTQSKEPEATLSGSNRSIDSSRPNIASGILDITACNPIPRQLDLKPGQEFEVKNTDTVPHTIIIDSTHQYVIPAKSSKTLSSTFGSSGVIGTIGYRCDNKSSEEFAGTFHISE